VLEKPGAHDVGSDLGKDAAFLLPLSGAVRLGIFVGRAVARPDTVVQPVTCKPHLSYMYYPINVTVMPIQSLYSAT